jgi:hypothetical protein
MTQVSGGDLSHSLTLCPLPSADLDLLAAGPSLRQVALMTTDRKKPEPSASEPAQRRGNEKPAVSPQAERALAEAEARRAARDRDPPGREKEIQGRDGPEPTRYGDWEINGLTSDF